MAKNRIAKSNQLSISSFVAQEDVRLKIEDIVGPGNLARFKSGIISAVVDNKQLDKCDRASLVNAALLGFTLGLSPSPQLGHYYIVPYKNHAEFQLGYKGYIQLAIRSGQYRNINVLTIKEGELISYDPLREDIRARIVLDPEKRENLETTGYYSHFELLNGFEKSLYWPKAKMKAHAEKYSFSYKSDLERGSDQSFWTKNFDAMAKKTMLRQLLSRWGILSIDMQTAFMTDAEEGLGTADIAPDFLGASYITEPPAPALDKPAQKQASKPKQKAPQRQVSGEMTADEQAEVEQLFFG